MSSGMKLSPEKGALGTEATPSTASTDWLQRNREAQQLYNAHHARSRATFEQELLAFCRKLEEAAASVDSVLDADILPISQWALDLQEEAALIELAAEELRTRREDHSAPSHVDPSAANVTYRTWVERNWGEARSVRFP